MWQLVAVVVVTNISLNIMDTGADWPEQGGQLARSTVVQQERQASKRERFTQLCNVAALLLFVSAARYRAAG